MGQSIGHWAFDTASRMRWPFGNTQEVKCISISSGKGLPGSIAFGSRGRDSVARRCCPAPVTSVTVPSGATSFRRANQSASGASAETRSSAFGRPRISTSSSSGAVS